MAIIKILVKTIKSSASIAIDTSLTVMPTDIRRHRYSAAASIPDGRDTGHYTIGHGLHV